MHPDKQDPLAGESRDENASPDAMRTEMSHSTAQNTVTRPNNSTDDPVNGGPSVGIEDSKFLMESSIAQNSVSMPQDSRFTGGENSQVLPADLTPLEMSAAHG